MVKMINKINTKVSPVVSILIVLGLAGCGERAAIPTDPVERAIYERQHSFKAMGREMKVIDDELKIRRPDLQRITTAAEKLMATGSEMMTWFPSETGPDSGFATDAQQVIWEEFPEFESLYKDFMVESERLIASSKLNDLTALTAQYHSTGVSCSNCHKPYRKDKAN